MTTTSKAFFYTLILFVALYGFPAGHEAAAAEVTASFPKTNVGNKPKNVLRPNNESIKCKKARNAYARTLRRPGATPLEINTDRRAILTACKISP